jgi:hypothetical protein
MSSFNKNTEPPNWLKEFWKKEPNWLLRYQQGSQINNYMCKNKFDKKSSIWKPSNIKEFNKYLNEIGKNTKKKIILYRGTGSLSPTMKPLSEDLEICGYLSTSKSKSIALEFAHKKGYLHILEVDKGVKICDFEEELKEKYIPDREREVLICPDQKMKLLSIKNDIFTWRVYN